jgi:NitT/TauT family transport system permease protein
MTGAAMLTRRWLSIPIWIALWFAISVLGLLSARILPDPRTVFATLAADTWNGLLGDHMFVTATRALTGFGLAAIAGVALGALIARSRTLDALLEPMIFATYPIPKIALFPILTFAFGIGSPSKIAFAFLECLYPIVVSSIFAVRGIKPKLIWAAESMGASRMRVLGRVLVPAALPRVFTGFRIALPIGLIVIIVTEMIGDTRGLGFYIADGGASFRADRIYAGIVASGALGYALDRALILIRKLVVRGG